MGELKTFHRKEAEPPSKDDPSNPTVNFHGERRSNETHESTTDGDARLARKRDGKEAQLSYSGNLLTENRNGLISDVESLHANGKAERDAAALMLERIEGDHRVTVGADKGYHTRGFVADARSLRVTPHVAQNTKGSGGSAIDERTTRHPALRSAKTGARRLKSASVG